MNSPGNGLFAGGIRFALGLHLGVKNRDQKKLGDLTADFFTHKYEFLLSDLPLPSDLQSGSGAQKYPLPGPTLSFLGPHDISLEPHVSPNLDGQEPEGFPFFCGANINSDIEGNKTAGKTKGIL